MAKWIPKSIQIDIRELRRHIFAVLDAESQKTETGKLEGGTGRLEVVARRLEIGTQKLEIGHVTVAEGRRTETPDPFPAKPGGAQGPIY